jgi:hypothetical protein
MPFGIGGSTGTPSPPVRQAGPARRAVALHAASARSRRSGRVRHRPRRGSPGTYSAVRVASGSATIGMRISVPAIVRYHDHDRVRRSTFARSPMRAECFGALAQRRCTGDLSDRHDGNAGRSATSDDDRAGITQIAGRRQTPTIDWMRWRANGTPIPVVRSKPTPALKPGSGVGSGCGQNPSWVHAMTPLLP